MSVTFKAPKRDRLRQKLLSLAPAAKRHVSEANIKSAQEMVTAMRGLAPRRTGKLASAIKYQRQADGTGVKVFVQEGKGRNPDAFYGRFQEFGTVNHPAQPFFFPVYRTAKKRVKARAARALTKSAKEVAGK